MRDRRTLVSVVHGGNVDEIARLHGIATNELVDFSANINPLGPPPGVRNAIRSFASDAALTRYPDAQLSDIRSAIARAAEVERESIVIGAGSAALFDAIVRALAPQRCALPLPAFGEYRPALENAAVDVVPFPLASDDLALDVAAFARFLNEHRIDLAILTNPHNPAGWVIDATSLRSLIAAAPATRFIIDEAFIDFQLAHSLAGDVRAQARLCVVRSLTKLYAMPSMRIGYAVAPVALARAIERFLPSWPISTIAAQCAIAALDDRTFLDRTLAWLEPERTWFAGELTRLGLRVLAAAANFITFALPSPYRASDVRARLIANHGLVVRDCTSFEGMPDAGWIRVAVRERRENERLTRALAEALHE